jgi:hypothetical protein
LLGFAVALGRFFEGSGLLELELELEFLLLIVFF